MADMPAQSSKAQRRHGGGGGSECDEGGDDDDDSRLPMREGWSLLPLYRLQGCWLPAQTVKSIRLVEAEFKARPARRLPRPPSFPKCGTTWLKALAFTVINRSRHPPVVTGNHHHHPLLSHSPHDLVPFLELPDRELYPVASAVDALPSPRLLCTHVPPALLPPSSLTSNFFRAVYLCREPKDVLVSMWYQQQNVHEALFTELGKAFELFCEGVSPYGPVWEHYLEYWKWSVREPGKVLFFKYGEMMGQPEKHVRMLAEFLGVPFTDEEESSGVVEGVVRLCSFQNLKVLEVNTHGVANRIGAQPIKNSLFFRSGKVGDWENHLTQEMAHKLDRIVEEKLKGSGLTF